MCTSLRIIQQNVNGSEIAAKELALLSTYEEADILSVHDLVSPEGSYDRIFAPFRVTTSARIGECAWAAIVVVNSDLRVRDVAELRTKYSVCVSIDSQLGEVYVLNVCLPASDELDEALRVMDGVLTQLEGEMLVATVETNAKSVWWSCTEYTDKRGGKIEDFVLRRGLCVLNCKDTSGKQWTPEGHADATFGSSTVVNTVMKWMPLVDGVDGRRIARTDLMLQNRDYRQPKDDAKRKITRLAWVVEEDDDSGFDFEDNSLTSFEGSASRWSEADVDKIGTKMSQCRLTDERAALEESSSNKSV